MNTTNSKSYKTMINDSDSIYRGKDKDKDKKGLFTQNKPIQARGPPNSLTIDLDIDNYSDDDLEKFFGLNKGYQVTDVETREKVMKDKLFQAIRGSGANGGNSGGLGSAPFDNVLAKKIIAFLNEAKEILIENFKENNIIVGGGGNSFVINKPESITNFIEPIKTFPEDYAYGVLNKLRKGTTNMTMSMNTLFRDTTGPSVPSDCCFTLSYTLKNVVSLKLSSIELPEKIYLLSNVLVNNVFFASDNGTGNQAVITIPEGCYDQNSLAVALANGLNTALSSTNYSASIDPVSGKTKIENSFNNFELTFVLSGTTSADLARTFGWILGFRQPYYREQTSYLSEALYGGDTLNYFYFVLDDYNLNYTSNLFAMFTNSYIDKNILAKIPYTNNNNNTNNALTYYDMNLNMLAPVRKYFGPVDIKKINIQLLNKYGQLVPLNLMDYSFTLEMEMAYDI
jgi:hypothetical protein